ncbi:HlyD family efflux transporter periplasmic adaptor subunit [Macrococcus capreoli]|uniref:HlyD family efflux transporter periplasmic adaptor subunit n=1 Tax=Macrococcus capreoli TaxID=2982690 RepID=UPI0021D5C0CB|nr:efflux RND transporter periplasmic adaptor subunit [Macrococcus sp. TMW 2.2395]MCU7557748.1 efflux RND transporter periplasmic adaptor subunit [Macrococcus sp. TMW 2.2395]
MKQKWFLPIFLSLIVLALIIASGVILYMHQQDEKETIHIDERIKTHVLSLDGKVKQNLATYFQKGNQSEPVVMHVKLGDKVQKGDPLFTYNDKVLFSKEKETGLSLDNKMIEKEQVEGQIAAMEAMKQDATYNDKASEIDAQLNWLDSELTKAENNIDILKEKQKQISDQIDALTIKASIDGKVAQLNQQQIDKFSQKEQTEPILVLSDDAFFVEGNAKRDQIEFLETGLKFDGQHKLNKEQEYSGAIDSFEQLSANPDAKTQYFNYKGHLDSSEGLYVGDDMSVKVHLSYKKHIWLPERYVKKKLVTHKNKQKLTTPEKTYYVRKVYGDQVNEEKVTVERIVNGQYLVTEGLTSIDAIKPFKSK